MRQARVALTRRTVDQRARPGGAPGRPSADADGAVVAGVAVEARDLDDVAGVRRLHELAVADVDAHVAVAVEEDEVAGLELVARDGRAGAVLRGRVVRERDADLRVGPHHEAGAVEALAGRRASPAVRHADLAQGGVGRAGPRRRG